MSRVRSNCRVIWLIPNELDDVMVVSEGMSPNCRSSGAVTNDAMVSGLAPGSCVVTWMVGKSTCGREATGNQK
jgi:hypothetical protein